MRSNSRHFSLRFLFYFFFSEHTRALLNTRREKNAAARWNCVPRQQQISDEISHSIYNALQFLAAAVVRRKFIRFHRVCVCWSRSQDLRSFTKRCLHSRVFLPASWISWSQTILSLATSVEQAHLVIWVEQEIHIFGYGNRLPRPYRNLAISILSTIWYAEIFSK